MPAWLVPAAGVAIIPRVTTALATRLPGAAVATRTVGNQLYLVWQGAANTPIIRGVLWALRGALGITATTAAGIAILDALPGVDVVSFGGGGGGGHPGQVVKTWSANGVDFVRLSDGRMGAFSVKRGTWKYWKPKKPIVMYSGGSSDINTLLKADRAAERQLRRLKKAIDRRFPARPRRQTPPSTAPVIIQESGPGGVQTARRQS